MFRWHALISPWNALKTKLCPVCDQQFKLQIPVLIVLLSWKLCQQYSFYSFQSLGSSIWINKIVSYKVHRCPAEYLPTSYCAFIHYRCKYYARDGSTHLNDNFNFTFALTWVQVNEKTKLLITSAQRSNINIVLEIVLHIFQLSS